jgi:DNA repair photolyase
VKIIVLIGNTDGYEPAEKQFELTKNALILRDLELLKGLAKDNLIGVNVSVTSLSEETRRLLEPRTTTIKKRLETIRILSENGILVKLCVLQLFLE